MQLSNSWRGAKQCLSPTRHQRVPLKISAAEEPSHAVAEQLKTAAKSKRWYAKPASMIAGGIAALGIIGAVLSGTETVLDKTQKILDFFGVQLWEKKAQIVLAADFPLVMPRGARDIVFLTITKKSRAPVSNCHVEAWMGGSTATVKRPAESFSMGSGVFTQHMTVEVESASVPEGKLKWGLQVTVVCDDGVSSEPLVVEAVLYPDKHR